MASWCGRPVPREGIDAQCRQIPPALLLVTVSIVTHHRQVEADAEPPLQVIDQVGDDRQVV